MFLFLDTSQKAFLKLGLGQEGKVIDKMSFKVFRDHSQKLLPALEQFLGLNKVHPRDLNWIVVCRGPGSFTGVRVGVAVANALAFALKIPVIGVPAKGLGKSEHGFHLTPSPQKDRFSKGVLPLYQF